MKNAKLTECSNSHSSAYSCAESARSSSQVRGSAVKFLRRELWASRTGFLRLLYADSRAITVNVNKKSRIESEEIDGKRSGQRMGILSVSYRMIGDL